MRKNFSRYKAGNGEIMQFLKKLSILTEAGTSISAALDAAARSEYFRAIAEKVKSGGSLSDALDKDVFPHAVTAMISVSEKSGDLSAGLSRACRYLEKKDVFRKKIAGALVYPAFVLALCCASLFILVSVLLPSFAAIFRSAGISLPPLSRFILDSGRFFPLAAVLLAFLVYFGIRYSMGDGGFRLPLIGKFRSKLVLASFYGSMAESLASGMSIMDSLSLSAGSMKSMLYKEKLAAAGRMVSEGNPLSESLYGTGSFDETDISLLSAGERSSSLDKVFSQLARLHEEDIESGLKTFSGLIEPASTLATGVVVGIIVFAMFMPIIKLISVLGG